ncbi:MAG: hypothetical protein ACKVS6_17220 [Planctomycetota bacterium]
MIINKIWIVALAAFCGARVSAQSAAPPEILHTLRLDHRGEARPAGYTITTAVPFAPGAVFDIKDIGFDVPGEIEALERHGDGSIRWARFQCQPNWRALKGISVNITRGGARPALPAPVWNEPPKLTLILTDPAGVERSATVDHYQMVESRALRQVLRADGVHKTDKVTDPAESALYSYTVFLERFSDAPFFFVTLLLRNDSQSNPHGAVRFDSYRMECNDPKAEIGAAWMDENGCILQKDGLKPDAGTVLWLLPKNMNNLWLGDGQTKMWRLVVDTSGDAARFRSLIKIRERPILPGIQPSDMIKTRTWGDHGDMVLGPPPTAAAKLALEHADQARRTREFGWNGAWGDVKDTHQTGSPRNGLSSDGVLRTLQTGHREWFDATYQKVSQQALRPILRDIKASEHPECLLFEGVPHPKFKDRIGRETNYSSRFAKFREGTSGTYRKETHGWNGFDHEHFTVDDLYACYLLTGDPWIQFELSGIGQAILTYEFGKKPATTHSSRGDGWVLRAFCQLYKSLGDKIYLDAAKNLVLGMDAARGKGNIKWLHENEPDPRQLTNHPFEMPWQTAIAINGLAAYYELSKDELAKTIALDAADFLVKDAWSKDEGVFKRAIATDGSGAFINETERAGTQSWIASALIAAYRLKPKAEYIILADSLYREVKLSNATFERGGLQWTWWQSYLRHTYDKGKPLR